MKCIPILFSLLVLAAAQNSSETPTPTITSPTPPPITTTLPPPITPDPTTTTLPPTTTTTTPVTTTTTSVPVTTTPVTTPPVTTSAVTTAPPQTTSPSTTTGTTTTSPATSPATTSLRPVTTSPPGTTTTEAPVPTTTPATTTNATINIEATSAVPTAKPAESTSKTNVVWIILGGAVGVLVVGIGFVFLMKRSRKDEGHDDDVISNYGGNLSSPNVGYTSNLSTSHFLRNIPPVVSPTSPIADPPLVVGCASLPIEEQFMNGLDIPRQSSSSSTGDATRRANGSADSPNLWQSAMTTSPQGGASKEFESSVYPWNQTDSYSIRPSYSSDGHLSDSFASKQSSSMNAPFRGSHAL
ncbi:hypothetical protein H310_04002 [Aphanomyces invadans]|uniref:Uncharacterized protein n=1 Tax=Aphanomyces invadans TaxID=157072 RepID=A0A024UFF2_9STRA|nr:hypothetical protein H310_04002 [Aphanomyces invadans]ETW04895.1 hypothetical protein H310_04002 [Aphanomyces invadans]|eukprot:XP_008866333.1 hypothetical protein H310_04002 [Aphanomyces invadans]